MCMCMHMCMYLLLSTPQLSVQHVLRGLLGPELEQEIGMELKPEIGTEIGTELGPQSEAPRRVRVQVHVRPIDDELLLPCPQSCGPLKHRLRQINSTAKRAVMAEPEVQALLGRVGAALGYENASVALSRLDQAREVTVCYVAHGERLPARASSEEEEEGGRVSEEGTMLAMEEAVVSEEDVLAMLDLGARLWRGMYSDPQVARLGMGRLLHAIEAWLAAAARRDPETPRLVLLSGHDSTLVPLLAALQLDAAWSWPPYAAHLRIELAHARRGGEPAARILYQGQPLTASHGHADQDRAGWISLEAFRELLRPARLSEGQYAEECVKKADAPEAAAAEEAEGDKDADAAPQHTLVTPPRSRM